MQPGYRPGRVRRAAQLARRRAPPSLLPGLYLGRAAGAWCSGRRRRHCPCRMPRGYRGGCRRRRTTGWP
eukprot:5544795-Alexandrium_andersonii.AAC.1